MRSKSIILLASFAAMFLVSCSNEGIEGPESNDIGKTEFASAELPAFPDSADRLEIDSEHVEVLHALRVESGRTLVLTPVPEHGVRVLDLSDSGNPEVVASLDIIGRPLALHDLGRWVGLVYQGWGRTELVVIDVADMTNPEITGRLEVQGGYSKSVILGSRIELLMSVSESRELIPVTISDTGVPMLGTPREFESSTTLEFSNDEHMVLVTRVTSPSPTTGENNLTPQEGAQVHVLDAEGGWGTIELGGPVKKVDLRGHILRVGFDPSHTGSYAITHILRTFDISDLTDIRMVADRILPGSSSPIFVSGGAVYGDTFLPIDALGQIGTVATIEIDWWSEKTREVDNGRRLLIVEPENPGSGPAKISVELYDVEDLTNPSLVASNLFEVQNPDELGLQITQIHVLENSVSVLADDQVTEETGLLVVPYSGALQLFTFSSSTVTVRGAIETYGDVELNVIELEDDLAILNGGAVSLHGLADLEAPVEKSVLELAPTITNVLEFNGHIVRRHKDFNYNSGAAPIGSSTDRLEIVPSDDIYGDALATIDIPTQASLHKVGTVLVSTISEWGATWEDVNTTIDIWDMSNPIAPAPAPSIFTSDLKRSHSLEIGSDQYRSGPQQSIFAVNQSLVFLQRDITQIPHSGQTPFQSWATVKLHALDLSDLSQPAFAQSVDFAPDRVHSIVADGAKLHVTTWEPFQVPGDQREYRRHFLKTVDYSMPGAPLVSDAVQVPGQVLHVDGNMVITADGQYASDGGVDARINRLRLEDDVAVLEASHDVELRDAHDVRLVGGHVLVSHTERWGESLTLDVIALPGLEVASSTPISDYLTSVVGWTDRHIVYASRGIVAVDVENASSPTLMPANVSAWQRQMIRVGDTLIIAAGRSGIIQL
ncbi:hypothetical protein FRD01_13085 [Microvenator marinus]|uniref:Uncharacterized protein n=1 Tax=Microvenator marinus TaxID=2600177 RepID=A0A5B8XSH4_9DELT|nr:hypothetical protein [Microvenator marinus]QED28147.1 hypothetical protein FRD01_13085 [Microvenator marinus]